MRADRLMPNMYQLMHNLLDQGLHQAPPVKLAHPQRPHHLVRAPCRQLVHEYGPVTKGLSQKNGYRLLHSRQKIIIKTLQHYL